MTKCTRKPVVLSESTQRSLSMYALAASAAGVGMLALAKSAEAKVVYTPVHVKIDKIGDFYSIDFNHDGIVDFGIWLATGNTSYGGGSIYLIAYPNLNYGNAAVISPVYARSALALRLGGKIGAFRKFNSSRGRLPVIAGAFSFKSRTGWVGGWANDGKGLKDRYLGVKFVISGQFHYGWERITVVVPPKGRLYGVLTGYAYETIPNKPIVAGKTKGADVITWPVDKKVGTLGQLAAGRK